MRLNRFLASCGLGSRRSCEQLVHEGRVFLNGEEVTSLAVQVGEGDEVIVDGKTLQAASSVTLVLKKPRGFLCTRADEQVEKRETIYELLPPHFRNLHYVGRLDMDSEGLLILTNSGQLTEQLTHPRFGIEKEYLVALDHVFNAEEHIPALEQGFPIEGGFAKASGVIQIEPRVVALTLTQGIKRQIRHMFETLGYKVNRLERVRIGGLTLPELKTGRWRVLTAPEIALLLQPPKVQRPRPSGERDRTTARPSFRPRPHASSDRPPRSQPRPWEKRAERPHAPRPDHREFRSSRPPQRDVDREHSSQPPRFEKRSFERSNEPERRFPERDRRELPPRKPWEHPARNDSRPPRRESAPRREDTRFERPPKPSAEVPPWAQGVASRKGHRGENERPRGESRFKPRQNRR